MKKILAIGLAFVLVMSLTACGGSGGSSDITTGNNNQNVQQEAQSQKPDEPEKANIANSDSEYTQNAEQSQEANGSFKTEATISEAVLVDEANIKITAKRLETNGSSFGPELKLLIENNSGKNLTFQCRNASVNGYMVETIMSADVANGKKANDDLTFSKSDLRASGIDMIADMEFSFHIFDMDEWETYLDTDVIQIKTSIADTYDYSYDDSGNLAYEGNGIKIVTKGLTENKSSYDSGIVVYIENTGNKDVTVQVRDESINGFMVDAIFSCDVVAGKRAVDTITFTKSDLEENDITTIEDIELSFHIFNMSGWDTIVDTEMVNITF